MTRGEVLERLDTLITAGHFDDMNSLFREHAVEGLGTHAGDRILSLSGHEGAYFSGWDIDFTTTTTSLKCHTWIMQPRPASCGLESRRRPLFRWK